MIRLVKENVERVAVDEAHARYLESKGYTRMSGANKAPERADAPEADVNLEKLTVKDLQKIAKVRGIQGATGLTKAQLIECLTTEELMTIEQK